MQPTDQKALMNKINEFAKANDKTAAFELIASLLLFFSSFAIMVYGLKMEYYWLTVLFLPLAGVLITRIFTIQHDCGHGSYFSSQKVNNTVGSILGVLSLSPYYYWKKNHTVHHAFSGNLGKRGIGDVDTLTVKEYQSAPFFKKVWYRLYRHPVFMLTIAPALLFGIKHRLPIDNPFHSTKAWVNIMLTNAGLFGAIAALVHFYGWESFFFVGLPVFWLGSSIGVAIFYIQHQYEDAYWSESSDWKYFDAGLHGSSHFHFGSVINWLINHINLHHIHHLNGHVPSYRLKECLESIPELQEVPRRSFAEVLPCFSMALWDDENKKMVSFG